MSVAILLSSGDDEGARHHASYSWASFRQSNQPPFFLFQLIETLTMGFTASPPLPAAPRKSILSLARLGAAARDLRRAI
jgi:hypothetical protein